MVNVLGRLSKKATEGKPSEDSEGLFRTRSSSSSRALVTSPPALTINDQDPYFSSFSNDATGSVNNVDTNNGASSSTGSTLAVNSAAGNRRRGSSVSSVTPPDISPAARRRSGNFSLNDLPAEAQDVFVSHEPRAGFVARVAPNVTGPEGDGSLTLAHLIDPTAPTVNVALVTTPELVQNGIVPLQSSPDPIFAPPMVRRESNRSDISVQSQDLTKSYSTPNIAATNGLYIDPNTATTDTVLNRRPSNSSTPQPSPRKTSTGNETNTPRKVTMNFTGTKRRAPSHSALAGALALSAATLAGPAATSSLRPPEPTSPPEINDSMADETKSIDSFGSGTAAGAPVRRMSSFDALGAFDDVVNSLGTGYAVASSKRTADFHALFPQVHEDDYLIEDYGCALQREILIQGRLYVSEHHLCFNANIFGWVTALVIPFSEVVTIEKRMTAFVIPNAIQVATLHARHTFASFLSRDTTYDLIVNIWRITHPTIPAGAALPDTLSDEASEEEEEPGEEKEKKKRKLSVRKRAGSKSFWSGSNPPSNAASPGMAQSISTAPNSSRTGTSTETLPPHRVTKCTCATHYKDTAMDKTYPTTPEKIYNLMYTSGFIKEFWVSPMKLTEIQMSDWAPQGSSALLARSTSYIKPLNGAVGPRSTKCLLTDECQHVDLDDHIIVLTTTRTPDVPSGGSFSVKTRTCITWAANNHCRVLVTTMVEWTARSLLKGVITSAATDGQLQYHKELDIEMRKYISKHLSEFTDSSAPTDGEASPTFESTEGVDADKNHVTDNTMGQPTAVDDGPIASMLNSIGLGFIVQTFGPLGQSIVFLLKSVFDYLLEMGPASTAVVGVIIILIISNLWTLFSLRGPSQTSRVPPSQDTHHRSPDAVVAAVKGALHEYFQAQLLPSHSHTDRKATDWNPKIELEDISKNLDNLELRVKNLREFLKSETETLLESKVDNSTPLEEVD